MNSTLGTSTIPRGLIHRPSAGRTTRPCDNCTCSPGLLSRQGRRASQFLKKMENNRRHKKRESVIGDDLSIYSSDSLCQSNKEVNTTKRLAALRKQMAKHKLCCYIVPSEDEHQSEYVSLHDQRRSFISGFTGSAGVACITRDLMNFNEDHEEGKSILSTDGRYFNQASQELDFNWTLLRQGIDTLSWQEWCIREAKEMSEGLGGKEVRIGVDPRLISYEQVVAFLKLLKESMHGTGANVELVPIDENLIDNIWPQFETVPEKPRNELLKLDHAYHGEEFSLKRERVVKQLGELGSENSPNHEFIVVALDEIAWLLNLRGSDIEYNPVFNAYLVLNNKDETNLFCDDPFNDDIKQCFEKNNISVKPYKSIWEHLEVSAASALEIENDKERTEFLIPDMSSWQLARSVCATQYKIIHSPIDVFKSVKNSTEINCAHNAQVKDAVCLVQYFAWLENELNAKEMLIDEYRAAKKLIEIRKTQKNFKGNSFATISATGANAAIIHYEPPEEGSSMIDPSKIYLCDSGSQFFEGTTDITRTVHFNTPSQEEIDNYTLVLKGNLALERLVFPEGTSGYNLDVIARQFLWSQGLDYRHGTGHGVGSFLNVHEGPIGIGFRPHLANFPLQAGNVITNEPGYYKDGEYGIRIENDMLIKEAEHLQFGDRKFLKFENMTLVPYCRRLINVDLLTKQERHQINEYHARIWDKIVQFIPTRSITHKWLKRETQPL
ncbi:aminopeptidase P KNAG_0I03070 [Huiozyma naganishii CBS 8797]|uniref:Xaa-Pro aminopeptidase n=1 Tax=Huiozyma naganishii (strain ATCC MYA-139 / BCRC 22969 / CBS 8797 / KCTC 17520 / NBRC 10181 / NCYC 3082 / Yp74L-3) TaxID=1071383 RepID=J7SAE4_HUIN7|nr:hypothetical protein KNAG_0I03070 [Kazachstania naganishii CBS 8797]CCK72091.1 hypothetical protein KNAG_0I03070 [Kazachstania naganishii CBS 8797]